MAAYFLGDLDLHLVLLNVLISCRPQLCMYELNLDGQWLVYYTNPGSPFNLTVQN